MQTRAWWLVLAVVPALAGPTPAAGQASVEVGPLVAVYAPLGSFATPDLYSTALPNQPSDLGGVAWGAEGRLWFTPRLGLQLQGAVASSRFGGGLFTPGGFVTTPKDARVVAATAQVLYRPGPRSFPLVLSAGAGVVQRSGSAYAGLQQLSSVAAALGVGFDLHVGRRLTATLGVTELLYSLNVQDPTVRSNLGSTIERGFQVDLLPHVTLAWRTPRS